MDKWLRLIVKNGVSVVLKWINNLLIFCTRWVESRAFLFYLKTYMPKIKLALDLTKLKLNINYIFYIY